MTRPGQERESNGSEGELEMQGKGIHARDKSYADHMEADMNGSVCIFILLSSPHLRRCRLTVENVTRLQCFFLDKRNASPPLFISSGTHLRLDIVKASENSRAAIISLLTVEDLGTHSEHYEDYPTKVKILKLDSSFVRFTISKSENVMDNEYRYRISTQTQDVG
jgi:hypothetical protein